MFWRRKPQVVGDIATTTSATAPEQDASGGSGSGTQTLKLSVIDFGEQVSVGSQVMKGFCAAGGSNEIQGCIWKVDDVKAEKDKPGSAMPRIHIEF
mmetsp:Transcript_21316/g.59218  ORF Transcript_21316/g.59218 Transcript_21316/m.59218 type:complete len:96 (+) Transcript_21316:185-472(+)|eukprot:CAMPEP_0117674804 /NCGR_PEP_ID=MMETSP0804-20121206/15247_1 /TAXON_ID=1074897 /ORGANISM="Tetraselmis astigmatica, Strain CCMP880" /LENGTH=95 /DNA_ID=CAMNT_0005483725 /DNA_START=114 /DNA_END=401 /DNA_ORIENTATION=+